MQVLARAQRFNRFIINVERDGATRREACRKAVGFTRFSLIDPQHQTIGECETEGQDRCALIAAVQFDRARRYINSNLRSPNLTPDQICANVGISRRQLYYLFERKGGVATYVRNRRLAACFSALSKSSDGKLVSSIAYEYGFTNPSSFYRQFHARYGFSPSEARLSAQAGQLTKAASASTFVDWLLRAD